jgi:hypothetical protein
MRLAVFAVGPLPPCGHGPVAIFGFDTITSLRGCHAGNQPRELVANIALPLKHGTAAIHFLLQPLHGRRYSKWSFTL